MSCFIERQPFLGGDKLKRHNHENIYSMDYYAYLSGLKSLNASFKVIFSVITLFLCIGLNNIYVSIFISVTMGILTVYKGKVHIHDYLSLLTIPVTFMILAGVSIAIGISKNPLGEYNLNLGYFYIYASRKSVIEMLEIMVKAFGAVTSLYMMTLSTTAGEIISVLRRFHMPKIITELMNMIYRFIFIIMEVQLKMTNSAKSRLGYVDYKTSIKTFGNTLSNLFIVSLKKASQYYSAMESRCYDGDILFLEEEKKLKIKHIFCAVIYYILIFIIYYFTK